MSGMEGYEGRISNPDEARKVAEAEKPMRDKAREEGVSPEIKEVRDKAAERAGNQEASKIEHKKSFVGNKRVNGLLISMKWNEGKGRYDFSFPELSLDESNVGTYGRRIDITDATLASKVFDYACDVATKESDPLGIFSKTARFADGIYEN